MYFLFDMSCNSSHLCTNSTNFSSISEEKQAALVASKRSKCGGGVVRLFTLLESSRFRPVRTRSVTWNFLAQQRRRNGTETWRRRSCRCQHLRLIKHEKILLNGGVPRRNGNETCSVNRPKGHTTHDATRNITFSTPINVLWASVTCYQIQPSDQTF